MPLLSVIVPFYNVEGYIRACLESLRRQTFGDLEVILVDDGSPDGTRAVAEEFCADDPRFRIITQENQGLSRARNAGARHATGEFITFVDSDDIVHLRGYEIMVDRLRGSESDFAICRAERFSTFGVMPSGVHEVAILKDLSGAHISRNPELVLDRMAWNKVYRRNFWEANGFEFPTMLLEDFPISVRAHTAARSVEVIADRLYFWRVRDGGEPSITQRSAELGNITDRRNSALMVLDTIEPQVPAALPMLRKHFLEVDVHAIAAALTVNDPRDHPDVLDLARSLVDRLGPTAAELTSAFYRTERELVLAGDVSGLIALHDYAYHLGKAAVVERRGRIRRRWIEDFPPFGTTQLPEGTARHLPGEPEVVVAVDDIAWNGTTFDIDLVVDVQTRLGEKTEAEVWLEAEDGTRIGLPATVGTRRRPLVGEDHVLVRTTVDPTAVLAANGPAKGFYSLHLAVSSPTIRVQTVVTGPSHARGRYVPAESMPGRPDLLVQPYRRGADGFGFLVRRPTAFADAVTATADGLLLAGSFNWGDQKSHDDPEVSLRIRSRAGAEFSVPVTDLTRDEGGFGYTVTVPKGLLAGHDDYLSLADSAVLHLTQLVVDAQARPLVVRPGFASATISYGTRMLVGSFNVSGIFELIEQRLSPQLTGIHWVADDRLRFEGSWHGTEPLGTEVALEHFEHPSEGVRVTLPLHAEGTSYSFEVDVRELNRVQAAERDPYRGPEHRPWHLVIPLADYDTTQVLDRTTLASMDPPREVDGRWVEVLCTRNDVIRLGIR